MRYRTEAPTRKAVRLIGSCSGVWAASKVKVGAMPPIAKPMLQDRPTPLARSAVGNLSFRKTSSGA